MKKEDDMTAHPKRRAVLAVMCLALATVVSAVSSLNVALPDLARETRASLTELQWIVDAYALAFAGLLLPAGALGDRIGRRRVLVAGLGVFGAASAVAMTIDDPGALIFLRAVMGAGAALIMPATLATITTVFPPAERDRAVAVWAGVAGGGAVLGLLTAGALLEGFDWSSIFALNVVLAVLALAGTLAVVPGTVAPDRPALDPVGALLSAAGLAVLVYGVIEGPRLGWTDPLVLGGIVSGVALLAAFVLWELRRRRPLLDPRLFALRGFGAGSLSITVQFFAFFGFVFVILQELQLVVGYSPLEAGLALLPMAFMLIALSPRVPRLVQRLGVRVVGPAGLAIAAAGFVWLSQAGTDPGYGYLAAGLAILGLGLALATTPATTAIVSALPPAKQGVASAVNDTAREVGGALGIAVLGSVLNDAYRSGLAGATAGVPPELADRARESLGAALAIADRIPGGQALAVRAQEAFADGLQAALLVGAGALLAAAVAVALRAPAAARAREGAGGAAAEAAR
jgi:EmrB/QacA subfamily drug resistance transporter